MVKFSNLFGSLIENLNSLSQSQALRIVYLSSIFIGLIIRIIVSVTAWGFKHPDEIYQSLEMAHYIVYGTGYVPPEFRSFNRLFPSYAASRSWLFPMFFAIFMYFGEFFSLNYFTQTLILIKIYMAIHSTFLIPTIYKLTMQISKDETTATFSAVFVAFWFRIIEYTVRTFTNTFFLPLVFYGIYLILKHSEEDSFTWSKIFEIGFLLGISTYIRVDMGIIVFSFFVAYFNKSQIVNYMKIGVFGLLFWIWGAWYDYNMYENVVFFSVIINWFTFNIIEGYSKFFGVSHPFWYIGVLLISDILFPYFLPMLFWPIIDKFRKNEFSVFKSEAGGKFKRIGFATLITWVIHSNLWITIQDGKIGLPMTHKEIRFMIGGLVMFFITLAHLHRLLLSELPNKKLKREKQEYDTFSLDIDNLRKYRRYTFVMLISSFLILSMIAGINRQPQDYWEGINRSLTYIGSTNPDPDSIYIAEVWFATGYYTYSHVSENTSFFFLTVTDEQERDRNINILASAIVSEGNNTYFVLPWYVEQHYENVELDLMIYNWTNVYEYDNTYVWTKI